jgi:hypothetical protein
MEETWAAAGQPSHYNTLRTWVKFMDNTLYWSRRHLLRASCLGLATAGLGACGLGPSTLSDALLRPWHESALPR